MLVLSRGAAGILPLPTTADEGRLAGPWGLSEALHAKPRATTLFRNLQPPGRPPALRVFRPIARHALPAYGRFIGRADQDRGIVRRGSFSSLPCPPPAAVVQKIPTHDSALWLPSASLPAKALQVRAWPRQVWVARKAAGLTSRRDSEGERRRRHLSRRTVAVRAHS